MSTTPPDDVAAMFDLPPPAQEPQSAADAEAALAAAEAELAAEFAAALESGDFAVDAPDSRTNRRVQVSWAARMQLPDGHVIDLEVRNVSQGGVGLLSDQHLPSDTVVSFEMKVPPFGGAGQATTVRGAIKTTYTVVQGAQVLCGGIWQAPPAGLELVNQWIRGED